ncbi:MAG: oligosaccharide flippase family protein [Clostridia bacterium]|nr:oligosaccharide flippase family protein [Clostridia bacterium]
MQNKKQFLKNGACLAAVSLFMRTVSMLFNAYIVQRVGAEAMGLLSLTMSVYAFAVTFATSGISLAITRLVAAALGKGEGNRVKRVMQRAVLYAIVFGGTAAVVLYFGSDFIATRLLLDIRTRPSLRLLSISLVPIALSAVYSGYFVGVRRVVHNAVTQIAEQAMRISLTVFGLAFLLPKGLTYACLALVGGSSLAELFSFFLLFIQAKWDMRRHRLQGGETGGELKSLLEIALPCAISAHARSGLVTVEHLLIPFALGLGGFARDEALASYAALHSMAIPVVLFPSAILASFSGLLVPECAELESQNKKSALSRLAKRALEAGFVFSVLSMFGLLLGADGLGSLLYQSPDAARYISLLAPLVPVMYLDSVVDAHLKGLGHQVYAMGVNIVDAIVSILAVLLFLPRFGADGYIYVIYLAECLNFAFSFGKLYSLVKPAISAKSVAFFLALGGASVALTFLLFPASLTLPLLLIRLFAFLCLFALGLLLFYPAKKKKACVSYKEDKKRRQSPFPN